MGLAKVTVAVTPLSKSRKRYEDLFLVDTGAVDCLAPRRKLLKAGIKVEGRQVYELASGEPVEHEYGFARLTFMGAETVAPIVMGPDDAEPLLGVVALENVGISVDPVSRTLKKMPAKPLKRQRRALKPAWGNAPGDGSQTQPGPKARPVDRPPYHRPIQRSYSPNPMQRAVGARGLI